MELRAQAVNMPAALLSPATHGSLDRGRYIRTGPDEAEGFQTAALSGPTVFDTIGIKWDKQPRNSALLRRTQNLCNSNVALGLVAEEVGFEPTKPLRV